MILTYDGVPLQIENFKVFEERAVFSEDGGKDYLYTHYRIGVMCVFNPKATTGFSPSGQLEEQYAPVSIAGLRHRLLQPRKKLIISFNRDVAGNPGDILIASPQILTTNGADFITGACDANNGPQPVCCNVQAFHGLKTAVVYYEIETWLNECFPAKPWLSHRWQQAQDIDDQYLTTRVVQGQIIFRPDAVLALSQVPDMRRYLAFAHQVPPKYKRDKAVVKLSSDNTTIDYTLIDREQYWALGKRDYGNITKVSGVYWHEQGMDDFWSWSHTSMNVHVEVWGDNDTNLVNLMHAATRVASNLQFRGLQTIAPFYHVKWTTFFSERHVALDASIRISGGWRVLDWAAGWINLNVPNATETDINKCMDGLLFIDSTMKPRTIYGSRLYNAGYLASQILLASCAYPALPSNPASSPNPQ